MINITNKIEKNILLIVELKEIQEKLKKTCINFKEIFLANNLIDAKEIICNKQIDTIIVDYKSINNNLSFKDYIINIFEGIVIIAIDKKIKENVCLNCEGFDDFISINCNPKELEKVILLAHTKRYTKSIIKKIDKKVNVLEQVF